MHLIKFITRGILLPAMIITLWGHYPSQPAETAKPEGTSKPEGYEAGYSKTKVLFGEDTLNRDAVTVKPRPVKWQDVAGNTNLSSPRKLTETYPGQENFTLSPGDLTATQGPHSPVAVLTVPCIQATVMQC
jgi:hypothetical protein